MLYTMIKFVTMWKRNYPPTSHYAMKNHITPPQVDGDLSTNNKFQRTPYITGPADLTAYFPSGQPHSVPQLTILDNSLTHREMKFSHHHSLYTYRPAH